MEFNIIDISLFISFKKEVIFNCIKNSLVDILYLFNIRVKSVILPVVRDIITTHNNTHVFFEIHQIPLLIIL